MQTAVFHKLLLSAIEQSASDVHLQVGYPPLLRVNGELLEVNYEPLTPEVTRSVVEEIMTQTFQNPDLQSLSEIDVSYSLEGHGRFRVNVFRQRGSFGIVLRIIPISIRSFSELNLPRILEQVTSLRRGLVMVVGITGSGKSTTLAAMVEHVNTSRRAHLVTIEDPIEFLFRNKRSVISQREVGTDTRSFTDATRAALRQDPDVIMVGEVRDWPTADATVKAAETGHLVLTSLDSPDTIRAIENLVALAPTEQQPRFRSRLGDTLTCVVGLRLVPRRGEPGRVPAVEVLRVTRPVKECLRDPSRTHEIPVHMVKGTDMYGMQTFDQHLIELVREGKVDLKVARGAATVPEDLDVAMID